MAIASQTQQENKVYKERNLHGTEVILPRLKEELGRH